MWDCTSTWALTLVVIATSLSHSHTQDTQTNLTLDNEGNQSAISVCPKGCICLELTVRCMLVGITEPPPVPKHAQVLDLRFNRIKRIPREAFNGLSNLDTLLLNNNHLQKLHNGAFYGLSNLKYLYLYKNKITAIEEKVFQNLPKLEHLYLHHNYIKHLEPNQFLGLNSIQRLFLHNNKLLSIPSDSFHGLEHVKRLRLDGNPLFCDCQLSWLSSYIRANPKIQVTANCRDPEDQWVNLKTLDGSDLSCGEPTFLEEPTDTDVTPGGTIRFRCRTSGSPTPEISWQKDGVALDPVANPKISISSGGSNLAIVAAQSSDVGLYECIAQSEHGRITSRQARVRYYQRRSKPSITHRPVFTEVTKGEEIRLSCGAEGFPRPTFEWFKDGGRLSHAHDRFQILDDGTLHITNVQLDDSAHYRCSATNYLGRASSAARVKVNLALAESIPQITSKPRDAESQESSIVEFTCIAEGHPYPDYSWWNNKRLINNEGRISVSNGGQHLRIQDLRTYDQGDYVCRAENRLGKVEATATLTVNARPIPIAIINQPHDMSAPKGTTVQLPCKAEGSPKPKISWMKDGRSMINDRRHRLSSDGSLVVYNVTESDVGMYECVAENERERRTARAYFSIRDIPYATDQPGRGDSFVLVALEEATSAVNEAINKTVTRLFSSAAAQNATPSDLMKVFRYPPISDREVAAAAEIYERTLELVAQKIHDEGVDFEDGSLENFSYHDLISPANLEVIANMSGCEAHRAQRQTNCTDMCFHSKYRSIDGTCNNFNVPLRGASLTAFRRIKTAQYENGFSSPIGWNPGRLYNGFPKPSARQISNELISTTKITEDPILSHMVMQWGQFLDHDIDHSMEAVSRETFENGITCGSTCKNSPPCFPIQIPEGDSRITPSECMEFTRSSAACGSGSTSVFFDKLQPREQLNQLTSFIDASQVYGSREDLATSLRNLTNDLGRLVEGPQLGYAKPLLPFNLGFPVDCRRDPTESSIGCFLAGDVRANEQVALLSMHTLWFREHNRLVTELRDLNPHWVGDTLYHEGRKIMGAQMQHITYNYWLPLILGPRGMDMLGPYDGYHPEVDASISNVFAASAFRFGHTLVNPVLKRLGPEFETIAEGHLPLRKAFFSPWRLVQEGGIDPIIRGLFASSAKRNMPNEVMNSELTERLFEVAHAVALDLGALNIQRGRDHGLPSYTEWREQCGLGPTKSFDDLAHHIKNEGVRQKLARIYGHPGNVDVWVGGLLEDSVEDGRVGPLVRCLLVEQFKRLRQGDRFWYENPSTFKPDQLAQIRQTSLGRVTCDNGDDIRKVTANVFLKPKEKLGLISCSEVPSMALNPWFDCTVTDESETLLSTAGETRFRRNLGYSLAENGNFSSGCTENAMNDVMETRIEGLEESLKRTRRKLNRMHKQLKEARGDGEHKVCIGSDGKVWEDGETWKFTPCIHCHCQMFQIKCQRDSGCLEKT